MVASIFTLKKVVKLLFAKIKNVPKDTQRDTDILKNADFNHSAQLVIKRKI